NLNFFFLLLGNLGFKIFDTDEIIDYRESLNDTHEYVKIPKICTSNNDNLKSYIIENGPLHEYKMEADLREFNERKKEQRQRESENRLDDYGLEDIERRENHHGSDEIKVTSRKFPSWSISISNMMEHQNDH